MSNLKSNPRVGRSVAAAAAVSGAIALAACGGNNDPSPPAPSPTPAPGPAVAVPISATTSVAGLVTYLQALVAIQDDTLKPVDVSAVTLTTDDTAPPTPI